MEPIEFCSKEGCLQIRQTDTNETWSQCWLLQRDKEPRFLGAENLRLILTRLLVGLEGGSRLLESAIDAQQTYWVFSLAEAHHVLYMVNNDVDKVLLWQDANDKADVICTMHLSSSECDEWVSKLRILLVGGI